MLQKFTELTVGQTFVFEGQTYVKSSPLMGRSEAGHERFMPRSALVETGSAAQEPRPMPDRLLPASEVMRALETLSARIGETAAGFEARGEIRCADELRRAAAGAVEEMQRQLGLIGE